MLARRFLLAFTASGMSQAFAETLKVFVLAGQSNMEGKGEVLRLDAAGVPRNGTLAYQLQDPRTAEQFSSLWDEARDDWAVLENVKIWFNEAKSGETGVNGSTIPGINGQDATWGDLTVGFGDFSDSSTQHIGPEYGFGFGMHRAMPEQKIMIIKTAWGGKTLAHDFRPPSSTKSFDPYCQGDCDATAVGHFYQIMLEDVAKLLEPGVLAQMFPDTADLIPEIAGFGWHQGWNDGCDLNDTAAYETNMVNLIKDLRETWKSPNMAVSIAVSGFSGFDGTNEAKRQPPECWWNGDRLGCNCGEDHGCRRLDIIVSQFSAANVTLHPELKGHVEAVETRGFWRDQAYSPSKQGYHWNRNAESYYLIGDAMASGMVRAMSLEAPIVI